MPLRKVVLKPGVNKEVTRYVDEQGWADCDKVRFRAGFAGGDEHSLRDIWG